MGMPGDTIEVDEDGYTINGKLIPLPPSALYTYLIPENMKDNCRRLLEHLRIPIREWKKEDEGYTVRLTSFEAYQLCEEIGIKPEALAKYEPATHYKLIVPRKGRAYRLNEMSLPLCEDAIRKETQGRAKFRDGKLFLDGRETSFFFFKEDYYWMLSDNAKEAVDSRHLGFIPKNHIIGNAWFCWYSKDRGRFFKYIP